MEVDRNDENEPDTTTYCSLTSIDGLTNRIVKTLRQDYPDLKIATKHNKTIRSLLPSVKDKTPYEQQSNVVYKIDCADCNACYVGMTTTKLKTRISGHKSNLKKLHTLQQAGYTNEDAAIIQVKDRTALVSHAAAMNHNFKLDETKILDRTHKPRNLPILESCHINNTQHTVNKRTDTDNLHAAYAGVLHLLVNAENIRR